jgi:hypothetical protein
VLAASTLLAQERRSIAGRVLEPSGAGVANAAVVLVEERSDPGSPVPRDVVEAATDDAGRFRAALLPRGVYRAAALGPAREDGGQLVATTLDHEFVVDGVELSGRWRTPVAWRRASGFDRWREHGPLRLVACTAFGERDLGDPTVPGWLPPPLVPIADRMVFELRDARGGAIHRLPSSSPTDLAMPPPVAIDVTVVDAEGRPVAGAEIAHLVRAWNLSPRGLFVRERTPQWTPRRVGTTDGKGRATVVVALRPQPDDAPEFAVAMPGTTPTVTVRETPAPAAAMEWVPGARRARIVLGLPVPVTGQIVAAAGPVAGLRVQIETNIGPAWFTEARTDAAGQFAAHGIPLRANPGEQVDLVLRIAEADLDAATGRKGSLMLPRLRGAERAFGTIDVRQFGSVTLQVYDDRRGPARGVVVLLHPLLPGHNQVEVAPHRLVTDAAGRVDLVCAPGPWLAVASDGRRLGWTAFTEAMHACDLTLPPAVTVRGLVRDAGAPVAGASVGLDEREHRDLCPEGPQPGALFVARCAEVALPLRATSDEDGHFELCVPEWWVGRAVLFARVAGRWSGGVRLEPAELREPMLLSF